MLRRMEEYKSSPATPATTARGTACDRRRDRTSRPPSSRKEWSKPGVKQANQRIIEDDAVSDKQSPTCETDRVHQQAGAGFGAGFIAVLAVAWLVVSWSVAASHDEYAAPRSQYDPRDEHGYSDYGRPGYDFYAGPEDDPYLSGCCTQEEEKCGYKLVEKDVYCYTAPFRYHQSEGAYHDEYLSHAHHAGDGAVGREIDLSYVDSLHKSRKENREEYALVQILYKCAKLGYKFVPEIKYDEYCERTDSVWGHDGEWHDVSYFEPCAKVVPKSVAYEFFGTCSREEYRKIDVAFVKASDPDYGVFCKPHFVWKWLCESTPEQKYYVAADDAAGLKVDGGVPVNNTQQANDELIFDGGIPPGQDGSGSPGSGGSDGGAGPGSGDGDGSGSGSGGGSGDESGGSDGGNTDPFGPGGEDGGLAGPDDGNGESSAPGSPEGATSNASASGLSGGAIAGIIVGALVGAALLLAIVLFAYKKRHPGTDDGTGQDPEAAATSADGTQEQAFVERDEAVAMDAGEAQAPAAPPGSPALPERDPQPQPQPPSDQDFGVAHGDVRTENDAIAA
ncbi:hypothetical protein FVE85_9581 [Porphyridium purpureum]|uniref:Uncharacterized protein n=1 Tax=Porphyridium purpureum TaxID=35688 RepID=A0A5J4YIK0_PORPP|nr:hypothetical protein FVE85_9581 [Porphyridium purpureum]|eukprot:POR7268..scf294_26